MAAGRPERALGPAVLRPVRTHHAFEGCVEQLATAIRLGAYRAGTALPPERDLAELMGVSRATLREAIAALRQAGMVETTRGRGGGTRVTYVPPTPSAPSAERHDALTDRRDELLDALVFRRVVEPGACWAAGSRELSGAEQLLLTSALVEVEQARDPADHRLADSRLHLAIATASGSRLVVEAVTAAQRSLAEMLSAIPVLQANIAHSDAQHRAIVTAILDRNPARARRAMEQHCDDTAALLRGLLDR